MISSKLVVFLLFFCFSITCYAADPLLKNLASDDEQEIKQTLKAMTKTGDEKYVEVFEAFRASALFVYKNQIYYNLGTYENDDLDQFVQIADAVSRKPLEIEGFKVGSEKASLIPLGEVELIDPDRSMRKAITIAKMELNLYSPDPESRLAAIRKVAFADDSLDLLPVLQEIVETDEDDKIRYTAKESMSIIVLREGNELQQDDAVVKLGELNSLRCVDLLQKRKGEEHLSEKQVKQLNASIGQIKTHQMMVDTFNLIKTGLSTGSILILMGLGLAITFGMMGIINMAHGELMMVGAYTTYCMQLLFGHSSAEPNNIYFIFAIPASFLMAMLVGALIEFLVVRKLYNRPLESLLATYGIGLILVQITRIIFGDNCPSNSPTYLQGGVEIFKDMTLQYNRLFIFLLTLSCLGVVLYIFKATALGLKMKASMQNRNMAAAMGINTRKVDILTFMIGSGMAGIAGNALITVGGITPDMGQNYIVDSFLVVVTGGVGNVYGVVCSGMGLGVINKTLESLLFGAVWSKIIVLLMVIVFIQFKPSGLFALKGRHADD